MSDSAYIPGLSNKYNSNESIKKIMDSKRVKLDKLEKEKEEFIEEKKLWNDLRTKASNFQY